MRCIALLLSRFTDKNLKDSEGGVVDQPYRRAGGRGNLPSKVKQLEHSLVVRGWALKGYEKETPMSNQGYDKLCKLWWKQLF